MSDYDCSPKPRPEGIAHHATRVVHNVFHPHHRIEFFAPMVLTCKVPELETVTVTAVVDSPNVPLPPEHTSGYGPGGGFYSGSVGYTTPDIGVDYHTRPVSVPEPPAWLLVLPAILIMVLIRRLKP